VRKLIPVHQRSQVPDALIVGTWLVKLGKRENVIELFCDIDLL
jgi:hypothetical protein